MKDHSEAVNKRCAALRDELENLPVSDSGAPSPLEIRKFLSVSALEHINLCGHCAAVLEDFSQARSTLAGFRAEMPAPNPWFVARVMGAIAAHETELEEKQNGVWISVRRLAPRLSAFAAVVLVLGGTWAVELRRSERRSPAPELRPSESLFEPVPATSSNDDVLANAHEEQRP